MYYRKAKIFDLGVHIYYVFYLKLTQTFELYVKFTNMYVYIYDKDYIYMRNLI